MNVWFEKLLGVQDKSHSTYFKPLHFIVFCRYNQRSWSFSQAVSAMIHDVNMKNDVCVVSARVCFHCMCMSESVHCARGGMRLTSVLAEADETESFTYRLITFHTYISQHTHICMCAVLQHKPADQHAAVEHVNHVKDFDGGWMDLKYIFPTDGS